jgi:tripartite-type tricarboxylate transporter receptor subunit TctC
MKNLIAAGLALCALAMSPPTVLAQDKYPSKPVTIIVGFAAGGAGDVTARLVAEYARE